MPATNPPQVLTIDATYDSTFKHVFAVPGETEGILTDLLNKLLLLEGDRTITELHYEQVNMDVDRYQQRGLSLDLRVTDKRGITYNIEVQRQDLDPILSRAIYQYSRLVSDQLKTGTLFADVQPVVIVLLCRYSTFPDDQALRVFRLAPFALQDTDQLSPLPHQLTHFDPAHHPRYTRLQNRVNRAQESLDLLHIYLAELDKLDQDGTLLTSNQKQWLHFLTHPIDIHPKEDSSMNDYSDHYVTDGADETTLQWIKAAKARLHRFAADPSTQRQFEKEQMHRLLYNSHIVNAKEEGLAEGLAEGEAKGLAEGKAEERLNLLQHSIPRLKATGLSDDLIAQSLGLSPEEVRIWLKAD